MPRLYRMLPMLVGLTTGGCELGRVNHDGRYAFLPGAPVTDTDPHPLRHFLIIEQDDVSQRTMFYYFRGTLGRAGLGIEDLRRIASRYGSFQLRFDFPLDRYTLSPQSVGGQGGEAGEHESDGATSVAGEAGARASRVLELRVDDVVVPLVALNEANLSQVGATRFLSTLTSGQWNVEAFFGERGSSVGIGELALLSAGEELRYRPHIEASRVLEASREQVLVVRHEPASDVDTIELDLFQTIERTADGAAVETILRTRAAPAATLSYSEAIMRSSFDANCWSAERPLWLRVNQIERDYFARNGRDFAVEHHRFEVRQANASAWRDWTNDPTYPTYCSAYE